MDGDSFRDAISTAEELIEEARNGRMFILVDHEDRENEGDLVIPAQFATPEAINFMATHGRGLICLAMPGERLDRLGLPLMAAANQSRHETAFTVSIEAREGVTTGISAHDRARTVAVAIHPDSTAADIATPGHVFPLRAREGGVLVRAGHTEAAVDIPRLAGLTAAGVICEIMNDDGTMARLPDLVAFAQRHGLKVGAISDLIAYRRRHDNLIRETDVQTVRSHGGTWTLRVFADQPGGGEHIALSMGDLATPAPALVRMHVLDPLDDVLGLHPERAGQVPAAMRVIAREGRGAVVLIRDLSPTALSDRLRPRGPSPKELRQYGVGAQILSALGVREMRLLTNSPAMRIVGLEGYGLSVVETTPLPPSET
ncbi:3,4-dihydroxy-2-butanone-4-phosphate synthase [Rubrimonas cliftonensis]|uniref:3,4-dihydroxy-2-butanone 4-phosphate synthase n=1 Tax=Rubrimonas cliftonensis TaxID=89524 RepID=A0A1H4FPR9_9RHOB|nr:3,4-dihydroxy-2-butanone-4-phosphate synthase [Rubrimonas cliftonensis]SEA98492.1 3,4-dihydroxy 2-butanone 4-phosphate synthase / GTP cyclohydrolase II [Rubrimonas cliftonensis]